MLNEINIKNVFSDAALARCIESSDSPFPHTDPDLLLLKVSKRLPPPKRQ
jgi:hypothetical protein